MKYPNMKVLYSTQGVKSLKYEDIIKLIIVALITFTKEKRIIRQVNQHKKN